MQLRSSKDRGVGRHSSERSRQAAAAVAGHDKEVHEAAMTLFLAKFSGSTGVQGAEKRIYAEERASPRKLDSQRASSSKRKLELSYSSDGTKLHRVATPELPSSKKQHIIRHLQQQQQQQQQQPSQQPQLPALWQGQRARHQHHQYNHYHPQQQQQQQRRQHNQQQQEQVLAPRHRAIHQQRMVQTDQAPLQQQQLLLRPSPQTIQQQQRQQHQGVWRETSSQTQPKLPAQANWRQQQSQRQPEQQQQQQQRVSRHQPQTHAESHAQPLQPQPQQEHQQSRQPQLQLTGQASVQTPPGQQQPQDMAREQPQRKAPAAAQSPALPRLPQQQQRAQRPALAPQHSMQQLQGTQLPAPGQTIQFGMVVARQCRDFEGTVTPLDTCAELPKYKGKGQLLGYVAVQHMKPILPEESRDKDIRMLQELEGTSRVVALCCKMPFRVRRAGAWRLVVK